MTLLAAVLPLIGTLRADAVDDGFAHPPREARPRTWWHWMSNFISKEGITKDLEAMAKIGLGGATVLDIAEMNTHGKVKSLSDEWFSLVQHAGREAERLGLELSFANCPGWSSSGGPWIKPENAMKMLGWTEMVVAGGTNVCVKLPCPSAPLGWYRDVAVVAFPAQAGDGEDLSAYVPVTAAALPKDGVKTGDVFDYAFAAPVEIGSVRLDFGWRFWEYQLNHSARWEILVSDNGMDYRSHYTSDYVMKTGARQISFPSVKTKFMRLRAHSVSRSGKGRADLKSVAFSPATRIPQFERKAFYEFYRNAFTAIPDVPFDDTLECPADRAIDAATIVDVTDRMGTDGTLAWTAPKGMWVIQRFTCYARKSENHPANPEARGLECDKLSKSGVDAALGGMAHRIVDEARANGIRSFTGILIDSYEQGAQNWTDAMPETFRANRGYDLRKFLPVLTGRYVMSSDVSERFLQDFRKACADLFAENYADYFAEKCHAMGLALEDETYCGPFDYIRTGRAVDVPMGEFWKGDPDHLGTGNLPGNVADVFGKRFVQTETFTAGDRAAAWTSYPGGHKRQGDAAFCAGVNRFVFHSYAHQPFDTPGAGITMGKWGFHFNRNNTLWNFYPGWIDYLSRCQYLLQRGRGVADILYVMREDEPAHLDFNPAVPKGFRANGIDADSFVRTATFSDGKIRLPSGMEYDLLVVGDAESASSELLAKIEALVREGANVWLGTRPMRRFGLGGGERADRAFARLRAGLWDALATNVWRNVTLADTLVRLGVRPDFAFETASDVRAIHRKISDRELYFVANVSASGGERPVDAHFRATGDVELWDPIDGSVQDAHVCRVENGVTTIPLLLPAGRSVFVVFRRKAAGRTSREGGVRAFQPSAEGWRCAADLSRGWTVGFERDRGLGGEGAAETEERGIAERRMETLTRLDRSSDFGVRHYSGTATYRKTFVFARNAERCLLDIGEFHDVAKVVVNGRDCGFVWTDPPRVDVTDALVSGTNTLEIQVANRWMNRVIGDEHLPVDGKWRGNFSAGATTTLLLDDFPEWYVRGEKAPSGRVAFSTARPWTKDAPLAPSGLVGPVRILRPTRYEPIGTDTDVRGAATGFFHLENIGGRDWAIDPIGRGVPIFGVDWCHPYGHHCQKLGYSPYGKYVKEHYRDYSAWADETVDRLKSWGFTALGAGCDFNLLGRRAFAHAINLDFGRKFCRLGKDHSYTDGNGTPQTDFPNVFHPDFESFCDRLARETCALHRDDPWVLGYFLDNELAWKRLADRVAAKKGELRRIAERYFKVTTEAVRRHDPNHLILGCRFAGIEANDEWDVAARYSDVVTFNFYPWVDLSGKTVCDRKSGTTVDRVLGALHERVRKPLMITEWSFPALDAGLPSTVGFGQRFETQAERAEASELCARAFLAHPSVIGYDYFMWLDDPALGFTEAFRENSNYGLVNVENRPYPELTSMFARVQRDVRGLCRSGRSPFDFRAKWITSPRGIESPALAQSFEVAKPVRAATLKVTGLGFYEAYLNGVRIGDRVLDPPPTDYNRRVFYSSYAVDGLQTGTNTLSLLLGHGWYDMRTHAVWNFDKAPWRDCPKALAQLEIDFTDGSRKIVPTDESWDVVESPIAYDCIREGEVIDARKRFGRPTGIKAVEAKPPGGKLESSGGFPGAKKISAIVPEKIRDLGNGRCLVTFPETLSGWVRLTVRGLHGGDVVSIRYDENLSDAGGPAVSSEGDWPAAQKTGTRRLDCFFKRSGADRRIGGLSGAQTDRFISAGAAEESFEPHFVYHGFRYVLIEGLRQPIATDDIRAIAVRTAFHESGLFSCSDATLTELVRMAQNSYCANFTDGIPTDCPHREKLGWTGDAWIASETGLGFFDSAAVYRKWYRDVLDTQKPDGSICTIAPTSGWGYERIAGPVFDAVLAMLPWNLWQFCGDRAIVDEAYPALCRYLAYEKSLEKTTGLVDNGLGEWQGVVKEHAPEKEFVVSCIYLRLKEIAAEFARVKGLEAESRDWWTSADVTRKALHAKYWKGGGVYANGGQTAQALAVEMRLCSGPERQATASRLVESVEKTGCHVDFGLVGSKFVYRALSDAGRTDLAYRMIVNPTEPSMTKWLGKNGTLWEDWGEGFSKCHVMMSDFAAWSQQYVGGIRRPLSPGYGNALIAPVAIDGMSWAKAEVTTPSGRIATSWRNENGVFSLDVTVPKGVSAEVRLSDGTSRTVGEGRHEFHTRPQQVSEDSPAHNPREMWYDMRHGEEAAQNSLRDDELGADCPRMSFRGQYGVHPRA